MKASPGGPRKVRPSVWTPGRQFGPWQKAGLFVALLALIGYAGYVVKAWQAGNVWAYRTWWNADVGVFALAAICVLGAFAWVVLLWRHVLAHVAPIKRMLVRRGVEFFEPREARERGRARHGR